MSSAADVVVVGAGPTGLMLAGELARRGISVRLVERERRRSPHSRTLVVQARTLEIMDAIGIAEPFTRRGYPAPGLDVGLGAAAPIAIDLHDLDSRFPYLLVLPQAETEEILETHLAGYGARIERGVELVSMAPRGADRLAVRLRHSDRTEGEEEEVVARYVVGCDGTHSRVRDAAGIPFEGAHHDVIFLLGDVKIENRSFLRTRIRNFTSRKGFVSVLPFLGEYVRIFAVNFEDQEPERTDALTLGELQAAVDAVAPSKLTLAEPRWLTRFRAPTRQVPANRRGRVFLAGDAAHAHSPAGGQGMNTGLQDAFNLGWKLAMVVRGEAPEQLLSLYDEERHAVDRAVQRGTDRMLKSFLLRSPVAQMTRDLLAGLVVRLPAVNRRLSRNLSGVGIDYSFSRQAARSRSRSRAAGVAAGGRLPDAELWRENAAPVRLYELLRAGGYTMLYFGAAERLLDDLPRLEALMETVGDRLGSAAGAFAVVDEGVPDGVALHGATVLVDYKAEVRTRLGLRHGSVLCIRPDGYVAFHVRGFDVAPVLDELKAWSVPRGEEAAS